LARSAPRSPIAVLGPPVALASSTPRGAEPGPSATWAGFPARPGIAVGGRGYVGFPAVCPPVMARTDVWETHSYSPPPQDAEADRPDPIGGWPFFFPQPSPRSPTRLWETLRQAGFEFPFSPRLVLARDRLCMWARFPRFGFLSRPFPSWRRRPTRTIQYRDFAKPKPFPSPPSPPQPSPLPPSPASQARIVRPFRPLLPVPLVIFPSPRPCQPACGSPQPLFSLGPWSPGTYPLLCQTSIRGAPPPKVGSPGFPRRGPPPPLVRFPEPCVPPVRPLLES